MYDSTKNKSTAADQAEQEKKTFLIVFYTWLLEFFLLWQICFVYKRCNYSIVIIFFRFVPKGRKDGRK